MAHYKVDDREALYQCPFDDTHMVRQCRFQYHLEKCRKNHPNVAMSQCHFNARHFVPTYMFSEHVENCPDKVIIEQDFKYMDQKRKGSDVFHGDCSIPEYQNHQLDDPNAENWDLEVDDNRGTFKFGDNIEEYFNPGSRIHEPQPLRRPRRAPQVLQGVSASGNLGLPDKYDAAGSSGPRIPKAFMDRSQAPENSALGMAMRNTGVGRGRGYGTQQRNIPPPPVVGLNSQFPEPAALPGAGRGYGASVTRSIPDSTGYGGRTASIGGSVFPPSSATDRTSDDDTLSVGSSASMGSDNSGATGASRARGRSRRANATQRTVNPPQSGAVGASATPPRARPANGGVFTPAPVSTPPKYGVGRGASGGIRNNVSAANSNRGRASDSNNNQAKAVDQDRRPQKGGPSAPRVNGGLSQAGVQQGSNMAACVDSGAASKPAETGTSHTPVASSEASQSIMAMSDVRQTPLLAMTGVGRSAMGGVGRASMLQGVGRSAMAPGGVDNSTLGFPVGGIPEPVFAFGGIGRGIGRGVHGGISPQVAPRFIVPKVGVVPNEVAVAGKEGSDGEAGSPDTVEAIQVDAAKEKRRLEKLLRQMAAIEEKLETGQEVNLDQHDKLARKDEVLLKLEGLRLSHD